MPAIRAVGAVDEPLPSMPRFTFGYSFLKPSAQNVIRLFRVSEPTELSVPDTPSTLE